MIKFSYFICILTLVAFSSIGYADYDIRLGNACVEWRASKTVGFLFDIDATGRNCKAQVNIQKNPLSVRVTINPSDFDSGSSKRDSVVNELLGSKDHLPLIFEAKLVDSSLEKIPSISGNLSIRNNSSPLTFNLKKESSGEIVASWKGQFKDLGIEPPTAGGGIVAKVHQEIELRISIRQLDLAHWEGIANEK